MRGARIVITGLASVALVAGCSSTKSNDSDGSGASGTSSTAPEDITTTSAAVATGLANLMTLSGQIATAAAGSADAGKKAAEGLEPLWKPIEGTVKNNDPDTYLAVEDAFADLESGDAAKSATAAKSLSAAVAAYLAKFSG